MHVHVYSMHVHLSFSGGLPMGKFENKVVLITGGGGGIGKAAARRFLDEGASVVFTGIFRVVPFLEQTEEHFEEALGSILRPSYWVSQAVAEVMSEREGGAI